MSLQWYRRPRLVALKPGTPLIEAARAIEQNRIGAIVVQDQGRVVGIVTDRDLAVRALGRALDPNTTMLHEVMTPSPLTLSPADTRADAVRLMQEHDIRRIPLVEDGRIVGMVTLDDLLLDQAAPPDALAAVVQAQIGEGGPAASARAPAQRRSAARARSTLGRLLNQVRTETGFETVDQAETALTIVLGAVVRRLTPDEAKDLLAQLPSLLQSALQSQAVGPDKTVTRESMETALVERLNVDRTRAGKLLDAIGATIAQNVSEGQMQDVRRQLPETLRGMFATPA